jgi:ATP-dependent RNA helicase DDX3X
MNWDIGDTAEALPATEGSVNEDVPEGPKYRYVPAGIEKKNPLELGWVAKQSFDYETYNKSSKELYDEGLAPGGLGAGDWASNAAKYEWNDEYGDVGPAFPELEAQLFGGEHRMRTGIEFSK